MSPDQVSSQVATTALINGQNLYAAVSVDLDKTNEAATVENGWSVSLENTAIDSSLITWVDSRQLQIEVPAQLPAGTYDLTVVTPAGEVLLLPDELLVLDDAGVVLFVENEPGGTGGFFGPQQLAIGSSVDLFAVARKSDGSFFDDVDVAWTQQGSVGSLSPDSGSQTRLAATRSGDATIEATHEVYGSVSSGLISVAPAMVSTRSFQEGVAGYSDTDDTFITEALPNSSFESDPSLLWDLNPPAVEADALIIFDQVFGSGTDQVPLGSTILSASLTVHLSIAGSGNPGDLREVLIPWDDSDTFNTFGGDPGWDDTEVSNPIGEAPSSPDACPCAASVMDVTASVAAWSAGATNYGWMFTPVDTSVVQIASSENGSPSSRPMLTITFQ
jgi:hypothetical protein